MKSNSMQSTPVRTRRRRQQNEALIPIPKTFAVNQLLLNSTVGFDQSKIMNNNKEQQRNSVHLDGGNSTYYNNNSSQYSESRQEPFYIDTIQKVKKLLRTKYNDEEQQQNEYPQKGQRNQFIEFEEDEEQSTRKQGNIIGNGFSGGRKRQLMTTNNEFTFLPKQMMNSTMKGKQQDAVQKNTDYAQTARNRNNTILSIVDVTPSSHNNRGTSLSFTKPIDCFAILQQSMHQSPRNANQNQSQSKVNAFLSNNGNKNSTREMSQNDQIKSYRQVMAKADEDNEQYGYAPEIQTTDNQMNRNVSSSSSSSSKRQKFHQNTFFRLDEEKALQFVEAEDILQMADIAIQNINHQQILSKRKKLYQSDITDPQKNIKCSFIQKTNLVQNLQDTDLNAHIKERLEALQNIENFRYQKKYGLIEIEKEALQITSEKSKTKEQINNSNYASNPRQETPFRKNSFVKHSRELSEFHIDNVNNRLYKQNNQNQQSPANKESNLSKENNHILRQKGRISQTVLDESKQKKNNQEIQHYQKEELQLFRRHQQTILEDIQQKKKKK